jgi:hypothetical protein
MVRPRVPATGSNRKRQGKLDRSLRWNWGQTEKEGAMRDNSGNGKSSNNTGNPTLKDHERAKGVSGEAIHGEKKSKGSDRLRTDANDKSP